MENKEQKAKEILKKYNQEHIIKWIDKQEEVVKQKIINQVLQIDLNELEELYKKVKRGVVKKDYIQIGNNILKNNKLAVVTMAGGQGTRLRT